MAIEVLVPNTVLDRIAVETEIPIPFNIDDVLDKLSWFDRDILRLWLDGESYAAIDRTLRLGKGCAATRVKRSLAILRMLLERDASRRAAFHR